MRGQPSWAVTGSASLWECHRATQEPQEEAMHARLMCVSPVVLLCFSSPSSMVGHVDLRGLVSLVSLGRDTRPFPAGKACDSAKETPVHLRFLLCSLFLSPVQLGRGQEWLPFMSPTQGQCDPQRTSPQASAFPGEQVIKIQLPGPRLGHCDPVGWGCGPGICTFQSLRR